MRLVLVMLALLMGAAVARDLDIPAPKNGRGVTSQDAFWQSERGQHMSRIIELMDAGDEQGFEREYESYRQKYNPPPMGSPYPGAEPPRAPKAAPALRQMTLPPEVRR